jgi:hypothetical protein
MAEGPIDSSGTNVTTAATAVALSSTSIMVNSVIIKPKSTNGGNMYIGKETSVDNTKAPLEPGDSLGVTFQSPHAFDLAQVWIDAATSGEGVWYFYVQE